MAHKRDVQVRAKINQKLTESGEKEKLEEMLRLNLIECGWRDKLKVYCREIVQERGVDNVTVEELVAEITPKARAMVPDEVKKELLQKIRTFLTEKAEAGS